MSKPFQFIKESFCHRRSAKTSKEIKAIEPHLLNEFLYSKKQAISIPSLSIESVHLSIDSVL